MLNSDWIYFRLKINRCSVPDFASPLDPSQRLNFMGKTLRVIAFGIV